MIGNQVNYHENTKFIGLENPIGQNNCFLNSAIQALWHLDSFRTAACQADIQHDNGVLGALYSLFIQYQYTERAILPPTELREALYRVDPSKYNLGLCVDSNEALVEILEQIHHSQCSIGNECNPKCFAHRVFGGLFVTQATCESCHATNEPQIEDLYFHYFYTTEIVKVATLLEQQSFGKILGNCLQIPSVKCPTQVDNVAASPRHTTEPPPRPLQTMPQYPNVNNRIHNPPIASAMRINQSVGCQGLASIHTWCLEPPPVLAIALTWASSAVESDFLNSLLRIISVRLSVFDLYSPPRQLSSSSPRGNSSTQRNNTLSPKSKEDYTFKGMVCYYGNHYVSIFQEWKGGQGVFHLFDDAKVRPLGSWDDVISICLRAKYQPVLLLYEKD